MSALPGTMLNALADASMIGSVIEGDSSDRAAKTRSVPSDRTAPTASRYILVVEGSSSKLVPLPSTGAWIVGRLEEADLRTDDASVSRRHARLLFADGEVKVVDLGSHNGTRVNGEIIVGTRTLTPGDIVLLGELTLVLGATALSTADTHTEPIDESSARVALGDRTILVADPAMRRIYELIKKIAASDLPVLITGETGSGKQPAAFAVHWFSPRRDRPFVHVNCAALPDAVFESELLGRAEPGGTVKLGVLETAAGGTVLLDEIGELSAAAQAHILRVLDTKRVLRIGDVQERRIDARIIAATHRTLSDEVASGRFRQDLLYRLSGAIIAVPPLRDRPCEISLFSRAFLADASRRAATTCPTLSPGALRRLASYGWPGNVRELHNVMEVVAATSDCTTVEDDDLPPPVGVGRQPRDPHAGDMERRWIDEALQAAEGDRAKAAGLLGMPLRAFVDRLEQLGLSTRRRP